MLENLPKNPFHGVLRGKDSRGSRDDLSLDSSSGKKRMRIRLPRPQGKGNGGAAGRVRAKQQARSQSPHRRKSPVDRRSKSPKRSMSPHVGNRNRRGSEDSDLTGDSAFKRTPTRMGRFFTKVKNKIGSKIAGGNSNNPSLHPKNSGSFDDSQDDSLERADHGFSRASMTYETVPDDMLPRGILKNQKDGSLTHIARHKRVGLINDPTHMPYHAGVDFEHHTLDTGDLTEAPDGVSFDFEGMQLPPTLTAANLYPEEIIPRNRGERARYSVYHGSVKRKFRVRPYHLFPIDFKMTEEEIYADSLKPSQNFIFLKSYLKPTSKSVQFMDVPISVYQLFGSPQEDGRIGALRAEVLGCISLGRNKPDISVYMVCGDAAFCTDMLSGYRSPMWPSLSRRAAVFPLHHAFVQLYVGVFDVSVRKNKENDNFCGRVVLDVSALRADTEYDVTFPLRASNFVYDRRKRGVIRLRFSVHWFSERAAMISYFKKAASTARSSPLYHGSPTIPCADPKTFRNVAVTVYGQDLPGKYSRNAFKATMREFSLYQQNMKVLLQMYVLDAIFYERVHVSLYLFMAGMYCVVRNSFSLVPAMCVGYIIIQMLENYMHYVEGTKFNMGYKPHTIQEIVNGLLCAPAFSGEYFEPHLVEKKTKRKRGYEYDDDDDASDVEIEPLDNREFPLSDRDMYPKWSVEDSLAPSKDKKNGGNTRLHGRLSVYYTAAPPSGVDTGGHGDDDDESSEDSGDRDDESIIGDTDTMFNLDYDPDELDDHLEHDGIPFGQHQNYLEPRVTVSRLKPGPQQDVDTSGRRIPAHVQLRKTERLMHKLSFKVGVEPVHAPAWTGNEPPGNSHKHDEESRELMPEDNGSSAKKKKPVYDEFDKLLGLHTRSANPVSRIMSSFLGPLMRICRIGLYCFRIMHHTFTWRDPYVSFWFLMALCVLCLILIAFPWRLFFFLAVFALLGPQNIFVRKHLERKLKEKAMKAMEGDYSSTDGDNSLNNDNAQSAAVKSPAENSFSEDMRSRGWFKEKRKGKSDHNLDPAAYPSDDLVDRPPFLPKHHAGGSKKMQPRAVVIPYSRIKKDRFFDWPPDPTVAKATPMPFRAELRAVAAPPPVDPPRGRLESRDTVGTTDAPDETEVDEVSVASDVPRGLMRRRPKPTIQSDLPMNLYL